MAESQGLIPNRKNIEITRDAMGRVIFDEWEKIHAVHEEVQISDEFPIMPTIVSVGSTMMAKKQIYIRDKLSAVPINTFCDALTKYRSLG